MVIFMRWRDDLRCWTGQPDYCFVEGSPGLVGISVWPSNDFGFGANLEPPQDDPRCLGHGDPCLFDDVVYGASGSFNKYGVMHRAAESDAPLYQ